ncbi:hypothetical protein MKW92_000653 [Papaver armeniacum]|nr:hypothetical protein MKW92_000653 [Papaver armeniacum]
MQYFLKNNMFDWLTLAHNKNTSTILHSSIPFLSHLPLLSWNSTRKLSLLYVRYGLQFVSPHNILVTTISGIGVVIEGIYMVIFIIYAPKKNKLKSMVLLVVALIVSASVSKVSLLAIHEHETCFSEKQVILTKSVEYMLFLLSLSVFLCGTSWFFYGLLGGDPFVTQMYRLLCHFIWSLMFAGLYALVLNPISYLMDVGKG